MKQESAMMLGVALFVTGLLPLGTILLGDEADFRIASITVHPTNMIGAVNVALGKSITPHTNVQLGAPQNLVDDDFGNAWYSYQGNPPNQISFTLDMGRDVLIGRFVYLPAQTQTYLIETSSDGSSWTNRLSATIPYTPNAIRTNDVSGAYSARYIRYTGENSYVAYVGVVEFQVFEMSSGAQGSVVSFPSQSSRYYALQRRDHLRTGTWADIAGQVGIPGTGDTLTLQHTSLGSTHFYRVQESDTP